MNARSALATSSYTKALPVSLNVQTTTMGTHQTTYANNAIYRA